MRYLLLAGVLLFGDPTSEGIRAFRAGQAREAQAAFAQALDAYGKQAPASAHYNLALAALHARDWEVAQHESAAAVEVDAVTFAARAPFLKACASSGLAEDAARFAAAPGAIPADWDLAIARGRAALAEYLEALQAREADWPEARRNAERQLLRLTEWERSRSAAAPARQQASSAPPAATPRVAELLNRLEAMERPPVAEAAAPSGKSSKERDW